MTLPTCCKTRRLATHITMMRKHAIESEEDGCFRFDVAIGAPLIGPIVRYRGWLSPE